MSETKWTPGPWSVDQYSDVWSSDAKDATRVAYVSDVNCYANARLIAAAPDLYEALKSIEGETELDGTYAAEFVLASIRCLARAALAKARGES